MICKLSALTMGVLISDLMKATRKLWFIGWLLSGDKWSPPYEVLVTVVLMIGVQRSEGT